MEAAFPDHFSPVAARYAGFRPRYPAALFDFLATLVPRTAVVWDCAAGNGQASADLAERFRRVIATDASAEQIAAAPAVPGVEFRVALAEDPGLPDASVQLVTVAQALHWFDLSRFYAAVRRVLTPGGVLAAWCYGIQIVEGEAVNLLVQEYYAGTVGPYWPAARGLVKTGYRSLPFPFAEISAPRLHLEVSWTLDQLLGYVSTWSATNRCIAAQGRGPFEALAQNLARAWGDRGSVRRVTWPLAMRVGRFGTAARGEGASA